MGWAQYIDIPIYSTAASAGAKAHNIKIQSLKSNEPDWSMLATKLNSSH